MISKLEDLSIGKVAKRELAQHKITTLSDIVKYTYKELISLHGVGPKALRIINQELEQQGMKLKGE